jgi:hypothetical protein
MGGGGTRATAFGLDVLSAESFPFLQSASARPTGRVIDLSLGEGGRRGLGWPDDAELISDQREPGGGVNFRIEADSQAGYLIWGPSYGANLLSADGCRLRCVAGDDGADAWQRLLIAQVLPFAAVLRGLEVMHAGAVALGGAAVALLGPSGAGKTSLAMALCRRGARFLADDVLTLETRGETLVAHPGTPVAGIGHAEADRLLEAGELEPEDVVAVNARERVVRIRQMADEAPLQALFFVDRRPDGPAQPRFEPAAEAQMLLAATFNLVLASPQRLSRLLEVCALAGRLQVERISVGPEVDAGELGAAVEARLGAGS